MHGIRHKQMCGIRSVHSYNASESSTHLRAFVLKPILPRSHRLLTKTTPKTSVGDHSNDVRHAESSPSINSMTTKLPETLHHHTPSRDG